ncbi:MAG TPA: hypothetical protein VF796_11120, partial [Humisphaera sp.]
VAQAARDLRLALVNCPPATAEQLLAGRPSHLFPPLVSGGTDLLRWAAAAAAARDDVEFRPLRRLTTPRIRWWFVNTCGLEFEPPDAFVTLFRLTGGIPVLLDQVDRTLERTRPAGANVERTEFEEMCRLLNDLLPAVARDLASAGPDSMRLRQREIQLLKMLRAVSRDVETPEDVLLAMTEMWDDGYRSDALPYDRLEPADESALQVLQDTGLIPVGESGTTPFGRLIRLPPDDPGATLADLMATTP